MTVHKAAIEAIEASIAILEAEDFEDNKTLTQLANRRELVDKKLADRDLAARALHNSLNFLRSVNEADVHLATAVAALPKRVRMIAESYNGEVILPKRKKTDD